MYAHIWGLWKKKLKKSLGDMDFDCTPGYSLSKDTAMHLYPVWPCLVADVEEMMPLHCCGDICGVIVGTWKRGHLSPLSPLEK